MTKLEKDQSIKIIGAGTWALSTALDLARQGFTDITCFDRYPVPSPIAAGNDSNKMMDYSFHTPDETPSPFHRVQIEALNGWKTDPVFQDHYHEVGFILAASSEAPLKSTTERFEYLKKEGYKDYEYLDTPEKFKKHVPVLTGDLPNWRGYKIDDDNGWLHARDALKSAFDECNKLGVKFVFGDDGEVVELIKSDDRLEGFKSKSGKTYKADKYVLTAGANAITLLDFEGQLQAKCFTLAHVKVTEEEAKPFKGLPIVFNFEKGFYFEPDENNEVKICNEYPGYTNNINGESIPLYKLEIPKLAEDEIRQFLAETLPFLKDREFVKTRICWCTDSPDRELILCDHPKFSNLVVGTGDSGLSFCLMPVIGKYISKIVVEGAASLDPKDGYAWRWRPETSSQRDNKQERWGGKGIVTDIKDYNEWVSVENPTPHPLS